MAEITDKATHSGSGGSPRRWTIAVAVAALAYAATGFYSVQSDQSGIAFVLGRTVERNVLPGIHWNPPWPFGRVVVSETATSFVMPVGFRFVKRAGEGEISDLWLTGDTNVVAARLTVQYSIASLADFELAHEDPRGLLRRAGERALTGWLVGEAVDGVLTTKRHALKLAVHERLQALLDAEGAGIQIQSISVQELAPPLQGAVRSAFQEVQNASADRERTIHEARAYRAQVVAEVAGEAEKVRSRARGDRHGRIEMARGRSERFRAMAAEHARAPELTEQRLYLETIDRLLPGLETYVVEPGRNGKVNLRIVR